MSTRNVSALTVLLLLPIVAYAQNSMVRGKVRASDGTALNSAIVELRESGGALVGQILTRNDGDFTFGRLGAGAYEVIVTMSGYLPGKEVVEIRGSRRQLPPDLVNETVTVEVILRPRPDAPLAPPGTKFVQEVPKVASASYSKGIAKIREGKAEEGIALLREAIVEFEDYFEAHFALGSEYYRIGKDSEALEELERARRINDRESAVYYVFGIMMLKQQKFRAAEYAFGRAVEFNDAHVGAHLNHAVTLIELATRASDVSQKNSNLADADRELDRSWELSSKRLSSVYLQRARIHQERGDREAAARELESYLKAEPGLRNAPAIKEAIRKLREKK